MQATQAMPRCRIASPSSAARRLIFMTKICPQVQVRVAATQLAAADFAQRNAAHRLQYQYMNSPANASMAKNRGKQNEII